MNDEGYIKFQCNWTVSPPLDQTQIKAINGCRQVMYQLNLIGAYPDGIGFGNISQRIQNNQFLISGSTTGNFDRLDNRHYAVVQAFDFDQNSVQCQGPIKASSESMSHAAVYQECSEINAVIHIHSIEMWNHYLNLLPTTTASALYGSPEMAREIIRLLRDTTVRYKEKIFVMGGHREGLIAFGKDLKEATAVIQSHLL